MQIRNEIIRPIVVFYNEEIGDVFILMDDNASHQRAHIVDNFLFDEDILLTDLSPCFPDMNLIQYIWEMLGRNVSGCSPPPKNNSAAEKLSST